MIAKNGILRSLQILMVDDQPDVSSLVAEVLVDEGAFVVPVNSGTSAISLFALMKFDLVILDLTMPQPDGFKVLEYIRATDPGLLRRTLVLTGQDLENPAIVKWTNRHITCLKKPFALDELVEAAANMALPGVAPAYSID